MNQPDEVAPAALVALGDRALDRGELPEACALAARVTCAAPAAWEGWALAAEAARASGDLDSAVLAYRRWLALAPGAEAALVALQALTGEPSAALASPHGPVPLLLRDGFLTPEQHAAVVEAFLARSHDLVEASVAAGKVGRQVDGAARSARVGYEPQSLRAWFVPLLLELLPEVQRRFAMEAFAVARVELQVTAHWHGDFYKSHRDRAPERADLVAGRYVSFVYYFRPPGGSFSGGQLRLYDGRGGRFTAVEPKDNRLVLFPSSALHEVMPVVAPSGRLIDGRFTLNGWLHRAV